MKFFSPMFLLETLSTSKLVILEGRTVSPQKKDALYANLMGIDEIAVSN